MSLRRVLLLLALWSLAAVRLPAAEVWFTSAPSPVESGQGYYVEGYAYSYYENGLTLSLYKNWGWFASGSGWSDAVAGGWASDTGPQTVDYLAEAYDPIDGAAWAWASVTVNGAAPPPNNPPSAWVEVDGYGHTATVVRPYGGTASITVRYKASDPDGNLARIRPQVWHPGTGLFTNDGGGWTGQAGGYGEIVRTVTLDRNGDWYFWADAQDAPGVFANSGAWGDAFRLSVVEGAPPAPGVPQNLQVSGLTAASFTLSWTNPGGAAGYEVRLNGGAPVAVSGLSYTFTGLAAGASHSAEVRAGNAGGWSGWVGAGATTGGSGGGTGAGSSAWRDLDGDGLLDEIVQPNTAGFDYYVNTWYTENPAYWNFNVNGYWSPWSVFWYWGDYFTQLRNLTPFFWIGYETFFELVLSVQAQAGEPFDIYRDTSGSDQVNPATWGAPIFNLPNGFPATGTLRWTPSVGQRIG